MSALKRKIEISDLNLDTMAKTAFLKEGRICGCRDGGGRLLWAEGSMGSPRHIQGAVEGQRGSGRRRGPAGDEVCETELPLKGLWVLF